MIGQILGWMGTFFTRLTNSIFGFLGKLLGFLFQKLFDFLKLILKPFIILGAIIFYFLYKLGVLVITFLSLLLGIGKMFFALVKGIFLTMAGFSFTPGVRNDGQWTSVFQNVITGLDSYQFDTLSYVLIFIIWFTTAFAAIKILSSIRGGM
jgi:hypothetical protein